MTPRGGAFDLGPVPQRVTVEVEQVRRLVAEQLPQWSGLEVRPVAAGGWDNRTFHLGDDMVVRMPSAAEYAEAVDKEHRWLPVLAAHLPLPVPVPLAQGSPGAGYPFPWSVYAWLDGTTASTATDLDTVGLAEDLAGFLVALRGVDPADGPRPGVHNWFRGGPLLTYDEIARDSLADLADHLDVEPAYAAWDDALAVPWDGVQRWFHGDLAAGNLLVEGGRLCAVIDFGTCGVGDPGCDLAVAWTLLDDAGRRHLRRQLPVTDAEWERGRGWALWKTLSECASAHDDGDAEEVALTTRVLEGILAGT